MDILKYMYECLPSQIKTRSEGISHNFNLELILNHGEDCEYLLAYSYEGVGRYWNPYLNGYKGFLYLVEGIQGDEDLKAAIDETMDFLTNNNLL